MRTNNTVISSDKQELSEYEKMKSGELFNPSDKSFLLSLLRSEILQRAFNRAPLWRQGKRDRIAKKLFGFLDGRPYNIFSPLKVVFGTNIHIGKNVFINCNCYFQDYADITIGDDVFLGPGVSIVTIEHPTSIEERKVQILQNSIVSGSRGNQERAFPVRIGNGVLIYSNSTICPGVTIGDNAIIGAGSVVTKDIPPKVLAVGVPCKVIRGLEKSIIE